MSIRVHLYCAVLRLCRVKRSKHPNPIAIVINDIGSGMAVEPKAAVWTLGPPPKPLVELALPNSMVLVPTSTPRSIEIFPGTGSAGTVQRVFETIAHSVAVDRSDELKVQK